ncbi:sulfatase family protein [Oceaniferula spumae]|uniref:sulfatase family protein n=1 Tax=Oceaniferula spumae TaxID=2979115 RepID=UPI003F4E470E
MIRLLWIALLSSSLHAAAPNIVLILSDDQAWTDYSFMKHPKIQTPALDKLAAESLTYTRGYVTAPLCRPSLASLFTGLYTFQHGITGNDLLGKDGKKVSRSTPEGAKLHQQLYDRFGQCEGLASELGKAGYISMQAGKWWESDPKKSGFTYAMTHGNPKRGARHGDVGLEVSRKGIDQIRGFLDTAKNEQKPFFLWHAPFLPHTPHNPPKAHFDKYQALVDSPHVARYYAMVEWFDQTCGELLGELEKRGLSENTVVIYVTDNGWIQRTDGPRFAPLSKQDVHEGGVRTPITIKWPGHIQPLIDKTTPVSSIDIAPTILKIAGADVPRAMTGIDLRDRAALKKRDTVYGADHSHDITGVDKRVANLESRFIVRGEWKLIIYNPANFPAPKIAGKSNGKANNPEGKPELYNLMNDPHETTNLAEKNPDQVIALSKLLNAWWDGSDPSK